jgi:hypothetical protein
MRQGKKGGRAKRDAPGGEEDCMFPRRHGIKYVRGAEVVELRDEHDKVCVLPELTRTPASA